MTITELIKNHPILKDLDFLTVYTTVETLIREGYMIQSVE